ncbi:chloride channel protein [Cellulosimicrobium arenosum]|uniref:Chloride channel protein n=1 Tax=Cellulosimicrobium arenosum TaxID=2708133 RepID=A0A927IYT5_9MICO|nr:chloride channel protein [Cellulosimicrobium arenosum]MBD8077920.1 chloride channel protein [Cellulosimicrobium arenosum]
MPTLLALRRARDHLLDDARTGTGAAVVLSVVVGAVTGVCAVGFRWLITHATLLFTGTTDLAATGIGTHPGHAGVPWLGPWFIVLVPAVGGLVYGPVVYRWAREARGHGVPEVMLAVAHHGGRIRPRVAAVKAFASAVCIGSGGSVGREGPIVQIGSALGSSVGQLARMPADRLRTLVAAGGAAGIAATFNAPVAGVLFALELILRDFSARAFGLVVLSSVTASVVARAIIGDESFLDLPAFTVDDPLTYLLFAVLGVLAGVVGIGFVRILYWFEDLCDAIWRGPEWARPAVGGLLLGLLLLALPQLYGVGYPVLSGAMHGSFVVGMLVLLLAGKVVATSLTLGIGGSGGVFAPSLFIGAMLGAAVGQAAQLVAPGLVPSPGAFAVVGMGAVFAGTARAPITAVVMLFELTGEYTIILPLMLAVVLATGTSRLLSVDTVYTLKLHRRGIALDQHPADRVLGDVRVSDVMRPAPAPVGPDDDLAAAVRTLLAGGRSALPVVGRDGRLLGQLRADLAAQELELDDEVDRATVATVLDDVARVSRGATLREGLDALRRHPDDDGGAVVDDEDHLVGWLTHRTVLAALAAPPGPGPSAGHAASTGTTATPRLAPATSRD